MLALSIKNLVKTYKNNFTALKGVSFDVKEGDFFALLGPNGAGKTTLIEIITSLKTKSDGQVFVFDDNIDTHPEEVKSHIGVVPQEFNFNPFEKVKHIVVNQAGYYGLPRKIAYQRVEYYLKRLELWDKRDSIARTLSGGMKRRLLIARALLHQPRLLILDEPTAGVDIEIRRSMWQFLQELNQQGTTIILTTHYLEEAENLCRHIAIIDHGKIIENDRMSRLLQRLQMETFIFYLQKELSELPTLGDFKVKLIEPTILEVSIDKDQSINDLFVLLSEKNIQVLSMKNKANRLEELFIRLTMETKEHTYQEVTHD